VQDRTRFSSSAKTLLSAAFHFVHIDKEFADRPLLLSFGGGLPFLGDGAMAIADIVSLFPCNVRFVLALSEMRRIIQRLAWKFPVAVLAQPHWLADTAILNPCPRSSSERARPCSAGAVDTLVSVDGARHDGAG
jgi:hypothetical protein